MIAILTLTLLFGGLLLFVGMCAAYERDRERERRRAAQWWREQRFDCPKPKLPPSLKRTCLVCRYVWRGNANRCARCGSEIVHTEEAGTDGK